MLSSHRDQPLETTTLNEGLRAVLLVPAFASLLYAETFTSLLCAHVQSHHVCLKAFAKKLKSHKLDGTANLHRIKCIIIEQYMCRYNSCVLLASDSLLYSFVNSCIIHVTPSSSVANIIRSSTNSKNCSVLLLITVLIPEYRLHDTFKALSNYIRGSK